MIRSLKTNHIKNPKIPVKSIKKLTSEEYNTRFTEGGGDLFSKKQMIASSKSELSDTEGEPKTPRVNGVKKKFLIPHKPWKVQKGKCKTNFRSLITGKKDQTSGETLHANGKLESDDGTVKTPNNPSSVEKLLKNMNNVNTDSDDKYSKYSYATGAADDKSIKSITSSVTGGSDNLSRGMKNSNKDRTKPSKGVTGINISDKLDRRGNSNTNSDRSSNNCDKSSSHLKNKDLMIVKGIGFGNRDSNVESEKDLEEIDVVFSKKIVRRERKDEQLQQAIDETMNKYQLTQSYWKRWMDQKRHHYSNFDLLGTLKLSDVKLDESLEIKKFDTEYGRYIERTTIKKPLTAFNSQELEDPNSLIPNPSSNPSPNPGSNLSSEFVELPPQIVTRARTSHKNLSEFLFQAPNEMTILTKVSPKSFPPLKSNFPRSPKFLQTSRFEPESHAEAPIPTEITVRDCVQYQSKIEEHIDMTDSIIVKESIIADSLRDSLSGEDQGFVSFSKNQNLNKQNATNSNNNSKKHNITNSNKHSTNKSINNKNSSDHGDNNNQNSSSTNNHITKLPSLTKSHGPFSGSPGFESQLSYKSAVSVEVSDASRFTSSQSNPPNVIQTLNSQSSQKLPESQKSHQSQKSIDSQLSSPSKASFSPYFKAQGRPEKGKIAPIKATETILTDKDAVESLEDSLDQNFNLPKISSNNPKLQTTTKQSKKANSLKLSEVNTIKSQFVNSYGASPMQQSHSRTNSNSNLQSVIEDSINYRDTLNSIDNNKEKIPESIHTLGSDSINMRASSELDMERSSNSNNNSVTGRASNTWSNMSSTGKVGSVGPKSLTKFISELEYSGPLKRMCLLGGGSEAKVYLVRVKECEELMALKQYELVKNNGKHVQSYRSLKKEFNMLRLLNHENIIQYYCLYKPRKISYNNCLEYGVLMEFLPGGSLETYIDESFEEIPLNDKKRFMIQILGGLLFLHENNIIHRDLKPANILLTNDKKYAKISDFGISIQTNSNSFVQRTLVGTPWYMAPEVINQEAYSNKADIWSAGCCFYHLFTGRKPYNTANAIQALMLMVSNKSPIEVSDQKSLDLINEHEGLMDFLESCFMRNSADRPNADALLAHEYLKDTLAQSTVQNE